MIITNPSGFSFEARKWRLKDMETLAERAEQAGAGDDLLVDIVREQWVRTVDPGPYAFVTEGTSSVEWDRILKPDILWSLFRVRVGSWPSYPERGITSEHYQFDVKCSNCKPARLFPQMVQLGALKIRPLPEESKTVLMSGRPFEVPAVDGRKVLFHLPTLQQDRELNVFLKRLKRAGKAKPSEMLAVQTVSVAGLKSQDLASRIRYFAQLELPDFIHLRDAMSRAGCNIITRIDATCDVCGFVLEQKLPLRSSFFMSPDPMEETPEEEPAPGTEAEEADPSTPTESSSASSSPIAMSEGRGSPGSTQGGSGPSNSD